MMATDERPDPMFGEAPDSGTERGRYRWRKAQGTGCWRCGLPIEGRTFEIQLEGEATWRHVLCVDAGEWFHGEAPRSGVQGLAVGRPAPDSKRAQDVARAMVRRAGNEGEQLGLPGVDPEETTEQEELWS